ncbi:MAG: type II toxin-antitoxin system RelE/ParE family toxin [Betaproteobacteria bacterium]|nr:type II toxin-antitoxin system RelE/ParE family toxin [Betaproteobacteria bacterium]
MQDRDDVWDFIATDNPRAAAKLADHPKLGRLGEIQGTRELMPHENYRLVYEISGETLWILALVRTARQWPLVRD